MAETKTTKKAESVKLVKKPTQPLPSEKKPIEADNFAIDPDHIGRLLHHRPAWIDEMAAIALIVFSIVTLLALFDTSPTAQGLSHDWSLQTRQMFGGIGAVVFALMIMVAGVMIALPRLGVHLHIPWTRILMAEIAFMSVLAIVHLLAHDPNARALARAGGGGGYVGWALSELVSKLLGSTVSLALFAAIAVLALINALGIRRKHVNAVGTLIGGQMRAVTNIVGSDPLHHRLGRTMGRIDAQRQALREERAVRAEQQRVERENTRRAARANDPRVRPLSPERKQAIAAEELPATASVADLPAPAPIPENIPASSPVIETPPSAPRPKVAPAPAAKLAAPIEELPAPEPIPTEAEIQPVPAVPTTVPSPASVKAVAAPEAPPRRTRHFTVEAFKETHVAIDRGANLPPLTLLNDLELNKPTEKEINNNARIIENTLLEFDIDVEVVDVSVGPSVTQYAVQPFREVLNEQGEVVLQRVRVNKIASLASDLALALSAKRLRIQPYVPGRPYMGIEVPNRTPSVVALRPVMESEAFAKSYGKVDSETGLYPRPLTVPLGRDVSGSAFVVDLATMPHLLIAGTTGSGKSVCITALTIALIMNNTPDRLKMVMLDPKMVELSRFNGLPHLLGPVETDIERIIGVLRWATREMDRRYKLLETEAARNIEAYNRGLGTTRAAEHLPYIVILIDEIGDLMLTRPEEMERTLTRLAQMARAVGMHLVVATQRPSVDIITGLIKANFPARISFAVASGVDSRVILDTTGAETLMGRGDMLYLASDAPVPQRLQGCYISDEELERIVLFWRNWKPITAETNAAEVAPWERGMTRRESLAETDPLLEDAIDLVVREGEATPSLIQRRLAIGYPRAAQLIDMLAELGVIGPAVEAGRARPVLIKPGTQAYKNLIEKSRK
jgi:S-DNA-T family DNA segregation ATPase FtsK/SpoIIIE